MASPLRLSLSTGILYHLPLRDSFAIARDLGMQGVELVLGPEVALRGAGPVCNLSARYGIPVLSVHPPIVPYPGEEQPSRILPRLAALATAVGAKVLVLHTPKTASEDNPRWIEFEADMRTAGERWPDLVISLENSGFFRATDRQYLLHDAHRLQAFADTYDLALTLDTAHAGTSSCDLFEMYDLFKSRLVNVHLSDLITAPMFPNWHPLHTFFRHHQMPGRGVLPLQQFVRLLVQADADVAVTFEISPTAVAAWSASNARRYLERAVAYVRQAEATA